MPKHGPTPQTACNQLQETIQLQPQLTIANIHTSFHNSPSYQRLLSDHLGVCVFSAMYKTAQH